MATGDTVGGRVRVVREDSEGNTVRVFGPVNQSRIDYLNNDVGPDERLYVNTSLTGLRAKPAGAESITATDAVFFAGEVLKVQHRANSTVSNDIDHDNPDSFDINILETDLNRGASFPETLTVSDQELSADPAEATGAWVTFYEVTVPDRTRYNLGGSFEAVAVEN